MKTKVSYPIILKNFNENERLSDCSDMRSNHYWFKGRSIEMIYHGKKELSKLDAKK